jgi:hypothetical protein
MKLGVAKCEPFFLIDIFSCLLGEDTNDFVLKIGETDWFLEGLPSVLWVSLPPLFGEDSCKYSNREELLLI